LSLCAAMTVQAKNAPRQYLLVGVAMASPVASLAISQVLAAMANPAAMAGEMGVAKVLRRAVHVWEMLLSVPNALPWNRLKTRCVVWPHKPTAKC
jgi:hypothetical protein